MQDEIEIYIVFSSEVIFSSIKIILHKYSKAYKYILVDSDLLFSPFTEEIF